MEKRTGGYGGGGEYRICSGRGGGWRGEMRGKRATEEEDSRGKNGGRTRREGQEVWRWWRI